MKQPIRKLISIAVLGLVTQQACYASGFSLYTEGSAAALGNFAAGIAAEAADATTGWYNPAGLALLHKKQGVVSGIGVFPTAKLSGTSTFTTPLLPPYTQSFHNLDGAKSAVVPAMHFAHPLGENATFGLSIVAPFGLSTDWDATSPVRYSATHTELLTTTLSPELGGSITEHLAIGAGIDFQKSNVKFNSMAGAPALLQRLGQNPAAFDTSSYNKGDSFAVGFHAGALLRFNDSHTRIGLNYQSSINHRFHGFSRFSGTLASPVLAPNGIYWSNDLFSNNIELPSVITLSAYQDLNEQLALLGSVVYTGWDGISALALNNVAGFSSLTGTQVKVNSVSDQNYRNTWRGAFGANYRINTQWMLRAGIGYDQTPTQDAYRDVRLPDANRWAFSVGAHVQIEPSFGVDVGYTYLKAFDEPTINKTAALGTSAFNVNAKADVFVHLLGAQLVWTMA